MRQGAFEKRHKVFSCDFGSHEKTNRARHKPEKILEAENFVAIEAYPGGAQDVLGIPRKQKGLEKLKAGLENLGIKGLNSQMSDHELDAVTCAYVGKLFSEGKAVIYGAPDEGIVMPKGEINLRSKVNKNCLY